MIKNVYLIGIIAVLAGCDPKPILNQTMDSWLNYPVDKLIQSWGAPTRIYEHPDGGQTLTWSKPWVNENNAPGNRMGVCNQSFTTDSAGLIKNWSYNGC